MTFNFFHKIIARISKFIRNGQKQKNSEKLFLTDDVYGISRNLPLNYVVRKSVDNILIDNLKRSKHIVIFGSSKQGKTCLRKSCLDSGDYILVHCQNNWNTANLNAAILKAAGYEITQSTKTSVTGTKKINATITAKVKNIGSEIGSQEEKQETLEKEKKTIELDIEDVNDIIQSLNSLEFDKYIVLEDFHYLPTDTQNNFSFALKAFHESSNFKFIIIGVWLEENRLIVQNGDLVGRVISVNADEWKTEELVEVVNGGAKLLNIKFSNNFTDTLISECYDSVYIVQEVCNSACKSQNIKETQKELKEIGNNIDVPNLIKGVVSQQDARYRAFIAHFSEGFQDTKFEMYKWLLYPVLTTKLVELENGLSYYYIRDTIKEKHPKREGLNIGNLTQSLKYVSSLQVKKNIKPIILDYDETNKKLNIVDKGFYIWLDNQNIDELLETANIDLFG